MAVARGATSADANSATHWRHTVRSCCASLRSSSASWPALANVLNGKTSIHSHELLSAAGVKVDSPYNAEFCVLILVYTRTRGQINLGKKLSSSNLLDDVTGILCLVCVLWTLRSPLRPKIFGIGISSKSCWFFIPSLQSTSPYVTVDGFETPFYCSALCANGTCLTFSHRFLL